MQDMFRFADAYGPAKIIHIYRPKLGLKAILVVDNVAAGPSIGGVRMAPDVSVEECFRLARAMTWKNAAAGLPHGGGKSVIFADPHMDEAAKENLIRAFAVAIGEVTDYIAGPDMGTNEQCMGWVRDEIGRAVGLPSVIGGIPLDEIGATGFGVAAATEVAAPFAGVQLDGARVVVQGFGAVGKHSARFLAEKGAILVAASDSRGTVSDPDGLDIEALIALKQSGGHLTDFCAGEKGDTDAVLDVPCDIWIPAARPDVVRADNVGRLNCKLVPQGANIPFTKEAESILHERGVVVIPDFVANAGGVICASVEYHGGNERSAFDVIDIRIRNNTRLVMEEMRDDAIAPRAAALNLARRRVEAAMTTRRWG
ncbi:Glu/Leu/Phe/Val family dehydrogenase [Microbaculum sp. FT89]|uniref:Glu/Leu/Phe/Val family dehydrogenase n=1 Tax=Microbaculum sp. FT89 TaxID=3447298 RepID=UPI003F52B365